jgi:hypothetical protein
MQHINQGLYCTLGLTIGLCLKSNSKRKHCAQRVMQTPPKFGHKPTIPIRSNRFWHAMKPQHFIYKWTNSSAELDVFIGMKCADLVSQSTTNRIASLPRGVWGKPTVKSVVICSHFHSGISRGFNKPIGLLCSTFTYWQIAKDVKYLVMSTLNLDHHKLCFKPLYILLSLG